MAELFEGSGSSPLRNAVFEPHPSDDELEMYSMGRIAEPESGRVEEHILICGYCQDRLQEADEFVALMKDTTKEIVSRQDEVMARTGERRGVIGSVDKMGGRAITALAAVVVVMVGLTLYNKAQVAVTPSGEAAIQLVATRSVETPPLIGAHASSVRLTMDTAGLPAGRLEMSLVSGNGEPVWSGPAQSEANLATVVVDQKLSAGQYFVRLSANTVMLREFAFRVR